MDQGKLQWNRTLQWTNLGAGAMHGLVAIVITSLIFARDLDWSIPVEARYTVWEEEVIKPKTVALFELSLGGLVATFSLLSVVNHAYAFISLVMSDDVREQRRGAGRRLRRSTYAAGVDRGRNPARWCEYAASASIMLYLIAALSGLAQLWDLLWLTACTFSTMLFGYAYECHHEVRAVPASLHMGFAYVPDNSNACRRCGSCAGALRTRSLGSL